MLRTVVIASAALLCAGQAFAQSNSMQVYGPGTASCATYLQDRSLRINADGWILGAITGMNRSAEDHSVGHSTDSRGLVGEVARVCRGQPSASLFDTTKQVYDKMKADGR